MADVAIRCRQVLRVYRSPSGEVQALRGVDVRLSRGSVVALVGPSGAGKSSLLRVLAGLDPVTGGTVEVDGVTISDLSQRSLRRFRNERIGFLWQRPADNVIAHLTVDQNVALALANRSVHDPRTTLVDVGLGGMGPRVAGTLSGGEQQRLGIGLARIGDPPIFLADEPTAELDRRNAEAVIDLLALHKEAGATVVVATHDPRVMARADEVLTLVHGTVAGYGSSTILAAIDAQGRMQLPADALAVLDGDRATVEIVDDAVVLRRPVE